MLRIAYSMILVLIITVACSCGREEGRSPAAPAPAGADPAKDRKSENQEIPEASAKDCSVNGCESKKQFCLKTVTSSVEMRSAECVDRPADCRSCACLSAVAAKKFPEADDVSAWIDCPEPKDGKYTIICYLP
jgi:hypothetical protein